MMYLDHFNLKEAPFSLTPNIDYFCRLESFHEALNVLLVSLRSGEGFVKLTGEVGTGKTLLCRLILQALDKEGFVTAYVLNPHALTPVGLYKAIAKELGITDWNTVNDLQDIEAKLNDKLLELHGKQKKVVLIIDESQTLTFDCLEAVRLLTNLETTTEKLLQIVLVGQPELDEQLSKSELRQLKQRITFSCRLPTLTREEMETYVHHRLVKAGYTFGHLFTKKAYDYIYESSGGIPRIVNVLCHKAMMMARGNGNSKVDYRDVKMAVQDTEAATATMAPNRWTLFADKTLLFLLGIGGGLLLTILIIYVNKHYFSVWGE